MDSNGIYITATEYGGFCDPTVTLRIVALHKSVILDSTEKIHRGYLRKDSTFGTQSSTYPAVNFDLIGATERAWFVAKVDETYIAYNALRWLDGPNAAPTWDFLGTWGKVSIVSPPPLLKPYQSAVLVEGAPDPLGAPQLGFPANATVNSDLCMAITRKLQGIQYLWTCHSIRVNSGGTISSESPADRLAIAWYKIKMDPIEIVESARVHDSSASSPVHYYMPSLAVNSRGEMLLGFSGSSMSEHIGAFYVGCKRCNSSGGSTTPIRYFAGKGYFGTDGSTNAFRWGDYSGTTLDPDDVRIWTVQECSDDRYSTLIPNAWGTRILCVHP